MAKDLVIVESPAKARTIEKFLGGKFVAKASMGHVRDLPRHKMGVHVDENGFKPTYTVPPEKRKIVKDLARAAKEANKVYLATDPDREGEAISWHLIEAAKIDSSKVRRVVFHEITERAVNDAFENPRELDYHLVDAQQARRILDRLVGYDLSPLLWMKVKRGLSAGRVQSVTLRIIVDREREIDSFTPEEFWSIEALFPVISKDDEKIDFTAKLNSIKGMKGRFRISDSDTAKNILSDLDGAEYRVDSIKKKEKRNRPSAPFITSTLQQEAWRKLRFTARKTMAVAQQLYEGVSLGERGSTGLITYMRTDSTNVASTAIAEVREYISSKFGREYYPKSPRLYTKKVKGAQEAHEAIRPTAIWEEPSSVQQFLNRDQSRLYDLIWKRMLSSQMNDAVYDSTTLEISASCVGSDTKYDFRANGSLLKFSGYRKIYTEGSDDSSKQNSEGTTILPDFEAGDGLHCESLNPEQHFTKPPTRYSEATLVRDLEEKGIGRPSTYAPTIATVMDREYVRKEQGNFIPTKLGIVVNDLLIAHFPDIMDIGFTARVEKELDEIAEGEREWIPVLKDFYYPFAEMVSRAKREAQRVPRNLIDEESDEVCEQCERPMVIKSGRFGKFLSCSGFPSCRNSRPLRIGVGCPECDGDLVERRGKGKGSKIFFGCSNYPNCSFVVNRKPIPQPCPQCSGLLVSSGRSSARCISTITPQCGFAGPIPEDKVSQVAV